MNYYIELMYYYIFLSEFEILIFSHIEVFQDINIVILKIQYRPALTQSMAVSFGIH